MRISKYLTAALVGCLVTGSALAADATLGENPFAPAYGHAYRHGAVPTREAAQKMREWEAAEQASHGAHRTSSKILAFGGGIDGIGVTSGTPRVYLVFWGSQWGSAGAAGSGDPNDAANYLQNLFHGIGTGGESWSGTMTQYCDGPSVPNGATTCNTTDTPHVGYPKSGAFAGVWFDNGAAAPSSATVTQLAQEAIAAAAHFGNTSASANRYAQYVVVSPSGTHPDGFGSRHSNFCAWHDYTTSSYGDVAFTNMPYVTDLGASCGENFVNSGSRGLLDGFSIVNGHEYAETLTDQNPAGGWTASSGAEDGDECAWISSGQGAAANVVMSTGAYAMQSTWSNDTIQCDISHAIL